MLGGIKRIIFKKSVSKTDRPFIYCKIGLRNTLFIFGRKDGLLLFVSCLAGFGNGSGGYEWTVESESWMKDAMPHVLVTS